MAEDLFGALAPLLDRSGLELVDVDVSSHTVVVTVDREGGIDLEALAEANRTVSAALDELDPIPGRYTLEVTSPGLERRLRRPEHFARAAGETVSVRTHPEVAETRRFRGRLGPSDAAGFTVEGPEVPGGSIRLAYDDVERVRTVFEWGAAPAPSPSRGTKPAAKGKGHPKADETTERVTTP